MGDVRSRITQDRFGECLCDHYTNITQAVYYEHAGVTGTTVLIHESLRCRSLFIRATEQIVDQIRGVCDGGGESSGMQEKSSHKMVPLTHNHCIYLVVYTIYHIVLAPPGDHSCKRKGRPQSSAGSHYAYDHTVEHD